jgi:hypothetical protein
MFCIQVLTRLGDEKCSLVVRTLNAALLVVVYPVHSHRSSKLKMKSQYVENKQFHFLMRRSNDAKPTPYAKLKYEHLEAQYSGFRWHRITHQQHM